MTAELILSFSPETQKQIEEKMKEEGVTDRTVFLTELLTRALTRHESTGNWMDVIERVVSDTMDGEDGTILIYASDSDDE
ncbi:hypothetical protein McpSp1_07200 [Methanocorpusculaceae archaeon Sp1]|uniref:Uncharacterized protein n=1 Tax=Methanorbis furvi TaxID=3028299 RepID=A0AAE4SAJ8_9EURY|nr:hypothetical protein [Methanocorpusculaceae archaeon Sp1]MDV0442446.1 hypothetical protein [Methanocorpusculaceae archaeon Ag1]